jgi:hypothetical protein
MREPLRVDEAYYISHDSDYSKFADAVMDVGPSPCVRYDCPMFNECKTEEKECFAFRIWVNNGGELNEKQQLKMGTRFESIK